MDFFDNYGLLTLFFLAIFPRLTLLFGSFVFGSFVFGGWLWWLGWVLAPHLLVAFLSIPYWDTNPVLVVIAWFIALGGTPLEFKYTQKRK